ncbi:MAG: hypothetical protein FD189_1739 [Elusimicrobia bacterium]|nr:MAG: hypothetical protein FD154_1905 [Elusimicrobiota bacterium]KAF0154698.1 MAG: hypothetical protein FD189_1739 [Elusimicrobiota bacterium]
MLSFLFYAALLAAFFVAGLYVLDWFIKSGGRKGDENISLNAVFVAGVALTCGAAFVVIGIFTGSLSLLKWVAIALPAGLVATFLWRAKTASDNKRIALELLTEEELRVREAARSDPKNAAAWARLAEIAEKKGEHRKALDYLEKVRGLEPSPDIYRRAELLKKNRSGL